MASGSSAFKKINENRRLTGATNAGRRSPQRGASGFGTGRNLSADVGF